MVKNVCRGASLGKRLPLPVVLVIVVASVPQVTGDVFTNSFLVRLHGNPGNDVAHQVAKRNGFDNLGPVSCCPAATRQVENLDSGNVR